MYTKQRQRTGGWQTAGWIGTLQADRAHVRALTISGWQLQNALPTQTMQMWRASLLRFNSAVELARAPTCLYQPQSRVDVSEISSNPKAKLADIGAGDVPLNHMAHLTNQHVQHFRQRWQRSRRLVVGSFEDASRLCKHRCLRGGRSFFFNDGRSLL